MNNVIPIRLVPEDIYLCPKCEQAEFLLWHDGTVMCAKCTSENEHIKVVRK
jgi:uncharacterized Zn finger protein (UPF0148 family)